MRWITPIKERIAEAEPGADHWLMCDECRCFFPMSCLADEGYWSDHCPFEGCTGHGLDFNLFYWDTMREPADPRWPASADELHIGQRAPDMEVYYRQQLDRRIGALVARLEDATGEETRYVGPFLKMMSDLCWDLTDPDQEELSFNDELAIELIDQLPVWSRTADLDQAPVMARELRLLFVFAREARAIPHADAWLELVERDDVVPVLQETMTTDRRLQRVPPARRITKGVVRAPWRPEKRKKPAKAKKRRKRRRR